MINNISVAMHSMLGMRPLASLSLDKGVMVQPGNCTVVEALYINATGLTTSVHTGMHRAFSISICLILFTVRLR